MDDDDVEVILCQKCNSMTCVPPPELAEYTGICPSCVFKHEVIPLVREHKGDNLAKLLECALEKRDSEVDLDAIVPQNGIAIIVGSNDDLSKAAQVSQVLEAFKQALQQDPNVREAMRNVLNVLDKEMPITKTNVPQDKIKHNDPRWS